MGKSKKKKKGKKNMEEEVLDRNQTEEIREEEENAEEIEVQVDTREDVETEPLENEEEEEEEEDKEDTSKEKEYYDRLVRLTADFDNYKKRVLKEKQEFLKYANERMIKEIIPVIDNLERALESAKTSEDAKSISDGVELILNQLSGILKREGLESVESKGEKFDPLIHEAISQIPSKEHPPHTVIEEQLKAYFLNKKLIRPAKVIVSTEIPSEEPEKTEDLNEEQENVGQSEDE